MSIPAQLKSDLQAFQAQAAAAAPVLSAPQATVSALQLNLDNLIDEAIGDLDDAAGNLDNWAAPADPNEIASGVTSILGNANDQWNLADIVALLGRVNLNLDQVSASSITSAN